MPVREPTPFHADALLSITERLESSIADLKVVHDGMKDRSIDQLGIVNAKDLERGLSRLESFTRAAVQAYHKHRMDNSPEGAPRKKR